MKKLFQNQVVAWIVLIAAVALACFWGFSRRDAYESRKTTELLDVKYYEWVNDDAKLLSGTTKDAVKQYNTNWNEKYYSVVAVATVPKLNGWTKEDYACALGGKWGLGDGDMLLLLVKNGDWYVACGDNVLNAMTDTQQTKLKQAIDEPYYKGDYDEAVVAFFRQADVFYAQAGNSGGGSTLPSTQTEWQEYSQPAKTGHVSIFKVILLIIAIFVVWAIIDRIRYGRYRRRSVVNVGAPAVSYYPIFWGRPSRAAVPHAPVPPSHPGPVYHSPARPARPSGTYQVHKPGMNRPGVRPANRPTTPARPGSTAKPGNSARPGGFGKGGFGGGKR